MTDRDTQPGPDSTKPCKPHRPRQDDTTPCGGPNYPPGWYRDGVAGPCGDRSRPAERDRGSCVRGATLGLHLTDRRRTASVVIVVAVLGVVCGGCSMLAGGLSPLTGGQVAVTDQAGGTWTLGYDAPQDAWQWFWGVVRIGLLGAVCAGIVIAGIWLVHSRAKRLWPDVPAGAGLAKPGDTRS